MKAKKYHVCMRYIPHSAWKMVMMEKRAAERKTWLIVSNLFMHEHTKETLGKKTKTHFTISEY